MRWRALETSRIYVRQRPLDAQLSVKELCDMVGGEGEAFSNHVLHYAGSLRGTRQYGSNSGISSLPWWIALVYSLSSSQCS